MATRQQKKKQTHVVRFYGEEGTESEDFWVDVEVLDRITFLGKQGNPTQKGGTKASKGRRRPLNNQWQETIVNVADLANDPDSLNRRVETKRVENPDDSGQYVDVEVTAKISYETRLKFQYQKTGRWFYSQDDNQEREFIGLRIINNNIDDRYLHDEEDKKTGRTTRQPPRNAEEYLRAVQDTNDKDEDLYLNVDLVDLIKLSRASGSQQQDVVIHDFWKNTLIYTQVGDEILPGAELRPGRVQPGGGSIQIDPLQAIINFGAVGGLAVEFYPEEQ